MQKKLEREYNLNFKGIKLKFSHNGKYLESVILIISLPPRFI